MILERPVSMFMRHDDTLPRSHPTARVVLEAIRRPQEALCSLILKIRATPEKEARRALKGKLPAITFGAVMNHRKARDPDQVKEPTGLLCLDFDHVEDVHETKCRLAEDPHVVACWVSPSGDGVKALVPVLSPIPDVFPVVAAHYRALGLEPDEARKDQTGLCYASYDPDLWVSPDPDACEPFKVQPGQEGPRHVWVDGEALSEYPSAHAASDPLMTISPDCPYQRWIEIGMALHCQFGGTLEGLALWDKWSSRGSSYPGAKEIEKHWQSFRPGPVTFRTILKYAREAGWVKPGAPKRTLEVARPPVSDELGARLLAQVDGSYSVEPLPFPILSRESMAGFPGSVVLLCGAPGSAKSWFVLDCLRHWTETGTAAEVLMLEEDRPWYLTRLLAQLVGDTRVLTPEWVRANGETVHTWHQLHKPTIDRVAQHLHCDGNVTFEACCEWVEKQCELGKRVLVIDPITLADPGSQKSWDADRKFMTRCKVAIERSGTTLILVTHPRKTSGPQKGPPQMDDLAGGVVYTRAAASVLWMNGTPEPLHASAMNASGAIRPVVAHKTLTILKARNSTGTGITILFSFINLRLAELGALIKEAPELPPPKRTPRMSTPPCDDESVF